MADSGASPQEIDFVTIQRTTYQSLQEELTRLRQQVREFQQAKVLRDSQIEQQTALLHLIKKLQTAADLDIIFQVTTAEVRQFLQADRVAIFRFATLGSEDSQGKFVAEDRRLEYDSMMSTTLETGGFNRHALRQYVKGKIEIISDIEQESFSQSRLANLSRWQIKAYLILPIFCEQKIWGLLSIQQCQTSRQWHPQEIEWLRSLLIYFSQTVQQAQKLRHQQQQAEQLQKLNQQLELKIQQRVSDWMEVNQALRVEVQKRQKINQELSIQKLKLRQITTHLPGAVFQFTGADGVWKIDYVSEGIYPLTGITSSEIMQDINYFIKRVYPEDLPSFIDSVTQAVNTSTPWQYEGRLIQPSGKICWWQGTATPTMNEQNQVIFCGILLDITESKTVENSLKRLNEELTLKVLQQTTQTLEKSPKFPESLDQREAGCLETLKFLLSFIDEKLNLTQEFVNTFLRIVNADQSDAIDSTPETEKIQRDCLRQDLSHVLNLMKVDIHYIQEIVTALDKFPHFESTDLQTINLNAVIDQTLMLLQSRLLAKSTKPAIQVIKNYGQLPPVNCYIGAINQVFLNILLNAINRLKLQIQTDLSQIEQNPCIMITTEFSEAQQVVKITIGDNASGVSEPQIFDPRLPTKLADQNAGFAMSISYQIVKELHHGALECISGAGEGTKFIIQVPISQASNSAVLP
jgi:signal transduction histidine kinase